ncbi:recombinase family protein [Paenibacillus ottowii]
MLVYAYPRVSTDEQAERGNSLIEQQERIKAYCTAMGWDDPVFYIEEGYSAKSTNRPQLTKLLEDIKASDEGGIIITTKLDRLSRSLFDILSLVKYFDKYNFKYVSQSEGFDTSTPAGRLVLQMLGMVAEFERGRISERVRDNMRSIAKNSKRVITRPCFGYDVINGQMVINIEEALIIRRGAEALLAGKPSRTIIGSWNAREIKTKEGNEWHSKVFRELYQRETLIGKIIYNKTYREDGQVITRDPSEWIIIEDHHEPILDEDTFEKLQALFEGRKTVGKHISNDTYLLSGLVYCGHCKSKMNGKMNRSFSKKLNKENLHYQYLCDGYLKKSKCYHHFAKRDDLEALILSRIEELSTAAPGTLQLVVSSKTESGEADEEKKKITARLEKLEKNMQKQIDAYNDDLITAHDLKLASERAKKERESLVKMLSEIDENNPSKTNSKIVKKAKKISPDISSPDRLKAKQAIRGIISEIVVTNGEDVSIVWRA